MTPKELFSEGRFQDVAGLIESSSFDGSVARILTVFNPSSQPFCDAVVFPVSMKWPRERPLPPIRVSDPLTGFCTPHRIDECAFHQSRITFHLVFAVDSVPEQGYKSYVAEYAQVNGPLLASAVVPSARIVIETKPQLGSLPLTLSFR